MKSKPTEEKVSIFFNENDGMIDPALRMFGEKGITLVISLALAKRFAKLLIDGGDDENGKYCQVGTFPLRNVFNISEEDGEKSIIKISIEKD